MILKQLKYISLNIQVNQSLKFGSFKEYKIKLNQNLESKRKMIYIEDENKQNVHPNLVQNRRVQFTDKLKRYPDTIISSQKSWQIARSKENNNESKQVKLKNPENKYLYNKNISPQISNFDISQLKQLSRQISLKNNSSKISTYKSKSLKQRQKQWRQSIMQPSSAEQKLIQKIDEMIEHQSFKPIFSTANRNLKNKQYYYNTMATELNSSQPASKYNSAQQESKYNSDKNKNGSEKINNKTSTLSQLINLSRFSTLSNKTLQKYLLCIQKQINHNTNNEMQKSRKISEFNLLETQRLKDILSTQIANQKIQQKPKGRNEQSLKYREQDNSHHQNISQIQELLEIKTQISKIYQMTISINKQNEKQFFQKENNLSAFRMLEAIKNQIKSNRQNFSNQYPNVNINELSYFKDMKNKIQQESTCLLD